MTENGCSRELREHWQVFLAKNPDARRIVDDAMAWTGLGEDEVLYLLMDAWAGQYLTQEQRQEFYGSIDRVTVN